MHVDLRVSAFEPELARPTALGATVLTPEPIDKGATPPTNLRCREEQE
jgi:hypothetical protein